MTYPKECTPRSRPQSGNNHGPRPPTHGKPPMGSWKRVRPSSHGYRMSEARPGVVGPMDAVMKGLKSIPSNGGSRNEITAMASPTREGARAASAQQRASRRLHEGSSTVRRIHLGADRSSGSDYNVASEKPDATYRTRKPDAQNNAPIDDRVPLNSLMRQLNQSATWFESDPYEFGSRKCLCEELNESFAWLESDGEPLTSEASEDETPKDSRGDFDPLGMCEDNARVRRTASF